MKSLRLLLAFLLLAAALPSAAEGVQGVHLYAPLPASKEMYSFADLYRLTTGTAELPIGAPAPAAEPQGYQIRTVAGDAPAAAPSASYVFSISTVARPQGGLLFLAGLAAAVWVARRRLGYSIRG